MGEHSPNPDISREHLGSVQLKWNRIFSVWSASEQKYLKFNGKLYFFWQKKLGFKFTASI